MNRFVCFFACLVSIYALPRQQSAVSLQKEMETQGKLYRHNTPLLPEKERRRVHHLLERGEHAVGALPPREIAASSDSVLNPYTISYPDRFNKEPSHALPVSSNALPAHQAVLGDRIEGLLLVGKTLSWKLSDMNLYCVTHHTTLPSMAFS